MHFVAGLTSGGVEQMLCNYCGAMNKDAYEFVLAYQHQAVETCKEKIEESGCRTIRITARSENFIKNLIDGYRVIKKERPDIVHAHMNLVNFCALLPAYLLGVKVRISHSHIAETNRNILFNSIADDLSQVAYIGDDINDLSCMIPVKEAGGVVGCPADAVERVKEISDFVALHNGGDGAVRDFIEWIIKE